jgi:hypothetical protein
MNVSGRKRPLSGRAKLAVAFLLAALVTGSIWAIASGDALRAIPSLIIAALLGWLLIRRAELGDVSFSQGLRIDVMFMTVLGAGFAVVVIYELTRGHWDKVVAPAVGVAAVAGVLYKSRRYLRSNADDRHR